MNLFHEADVIGISVYELNMEAIKYVGVRSEKPSIWKFFLPGFGNGLSYFHKSIYLLISIYLYLVIY